MRTKIVQIYFFKYQSALFFITIRISNKYAETKREDVPAYCQKANLSRNCVTIPLPKNGTDNGMEKDGKMG